MDFKTAARTNFDTIRPTDRVHGIITKGGEAPTCASAC